MKKLLVFIILSACLSLSIQAQYTVSGIITDESSGKPLTGANIQLEHTFLGCTSDVMGHFKLQDMKPGAHTILISYIGYQPVRMPITIESDSQISIRMVPAPLLQEEVTILSTRISHGFAGTSDKLDKLTIRQRNMGKDIPFLVGISPSVTTTSDAGNDVGYSGLRIRGTDMSRINVTINGIPYNDPETQSVYWVDLPDFSSSIENIQIQRGVGTSTNGAAAFGASMNFQTQAIDPEPYAEIESSAGSFNTYKTRIAVGSGLIKDKFSFDARLSRISSDGYIDRASSLLKSYYLSGGYYSKNTIVRINTFSGYEKTYHAWEGVPGDSLETNRTFNPAGMYFDTNGIMQFYENQTDNYRQDHYQLIISQQIGDELILNLTGFLVKGKGYYESYKTGEDLSDYGDDFFIADSTVNESDLINQKWLDNDFAGLTFSALFEPGPKINFTVGGAFQVYDGDHFGTVIWARDALIVDKDRHWYENEGKKDEGNIYIKADYKLNSKISLFGDFQYRAISYKLNGIHDNLKEISLDKAFHFFNPKAGATFEINSRNSIYTLFGIANREPSRRNYLDADAGKEPESEVLYDYELGYTFKSTRAALNINGYAMLYHNQLVLTGEINNVGDPIMVNVPESYRLGLELEGSVLLVKKLTWEANMTLSRNKISDFTEYVDNWDTWGQESKHLGMTDLSFSPGIIVHNTFIYEPIERLRITLLSSYVSRQYIDNTSSEDRSLDPYFINNILFNYTIPAKFVREIGFDLMINNLTNAKYETDAWVYRYIFEGTEEKMDGFFPQSILNFMAGLRLSF
jgi:iron complex outermembrane receptor protein